MLQSYQKSLVNGIPSLSANPSLFKPWFCIFIAFATEKSFFSKIIRTKFVFLQGLTNDTAETNFLPLTDHGCILSTLGTPLACFSAVSDTAPWDGRAARRTSRHLDFGCAQHLLILVLLAPFPVISLLNTSQSYLVMVTKTSQVVWFRLFWDIQVLLFSK